MGYIVGIYKDIQCRWVKSCSRCVKAYNSRIPPPRAILTAARVGRYDHITPIYIPPYAVPPATLIPGSPVSGLTWSQGSRVTDHHRSQGHWVTGSWVTRVTGSSDLSPAFSPSPISPGSLWSPVTGHHESPSPWLSGLGSPRSQGHRVTPYPSP